MWKSFFLAVGVSLCILGAECLFIEKAVLASKDATDFAQAQTPFSMPFLQEPPQPPAREITPPEWAPWTLLSLGAVTMIYSFTVPKLVATP